jgi:beta-lactamase class A
MTATPNPELGYVWPSRVPDGLVVQQETSAADERSFTLELIDPADPQRTLTLRGGEGVTAPPAVGSKPITVRGQDGLAFTTGAGYLIYWQEQGQPYAIAGFFSADELTEIANTSALLHRQRWTDQLSVGRAWIQNSDAVYIWPTKLPDGFEADVAQSGTSEMGAQLALRNSADPEQHIFIREDILGTEGEQGPAVTVRGLPGTSVHTASGWGVEWWEQGRHYTVGNAAFENAGGGLATLDEAVALAESLEMIDWETWRARLDALKSAGQAAPGECRLSSDAKALSSVTLGAPFCIAWRDAYEDERGFRITLSYLSDSGETFSYEAGPNIEQLVVPESDRPSTESPEVCARRSSFSISVEALMPDGSIPVGGMAMDSECGMGLAPVSEPIPAAAIDPELAALQAELATLIESWAGEHALSVTDLQTGQTISVHGDRPQLAACAVKIALMMAVAQDIEAGRYTEQDVAALVQATMGPSDTWSARELLGRIGDGDIGAGVHRVNALMTELGATRSIMTHPPGYSWEEYGYLESHGTDENRVTTDDLNLILGKLYRGEALSPWATEYVLHSMTIAPDWMDQPLRAAVGAEPRIYHKIGQLYEPENVWNDAAIIVFERDGQRQAYAFSYLGGYGASWQEAYAHESELAAIVWGSMSAASDA